MSNLIFRQLFEHASSTYTYIVGCASTKVALIIDPVVETVQRDVNLLDQLGLQLKFAANTHVHADHVTGSGELKHSLSNVKSIIARLSKGRADVFVDDRDVFDVGNLKFEVRSTPGHTDGCVTYVLHSNSMAFTGDALLIRGCGRTDFQSGNAGMLYDSVHSKIFSLPDNFVLYPAHDYKGLTMTSVEEEKKYNPRLTKTREQFVELMDNLNLPYPKQIDKSLPANLVCGIFELMDEKTKKSVLESFAHDSSQKH